MKTKLHHEFGKERQCLHCGVFVKQAAMTAGLPEREDIRLEFVGGVHDGLSCVAQFPHSSFTTGDAWMVSKGDRLHQYAAEEVQRRVCGLRSFRLHFCKIKAAR